MAAIYQELMGLWTPAARADNTYMLEISLTRSTGPRILLHAPVAFNLNCVAIASVTKSPYVGGAKVL